MGDCLAGGVIVVVYYFYFSVDTIKPFYQVFKCPNIPPLIKLISVRLLSVSRSTN